MSVTEYAAEFVELAKFYPHYTAETAEFSKCIKFENSLRPDIQRAIGYQQIRVFPDLVNSWQTEDGLGERSKKKDVPAEITYFNCGEKGHKSTVCPEEVKKCFWCDKKSHTLADCKDGDIVCFNCKEEGHIGSQCKQPKRALTTGRVFALNSKMAGRNDAAIAVALQAVAQAVGQHPQVGAGNDEVRMREFLNRYFPEDVRGKKEIEFLELKQGDMSVTEYAAKFMELAKFYPHYTAETAEFSKCIKFENGLRADIKRAIGYQKIRQFSELVSSCRIYEDDTKAHYKARGERRNKDKSRLKPYSAPGEHRLNDERRPKKEETPAEIVCYRCGEKGHKSNTCTGKVKRCFRCGEKGHNEVDCNHDDVVCYNCKEESHISSKCKKPKKAQTGGKVFALTGTQMMHE
ncbi:uncharacterized protein [Medicago truncatula]|uniref:uncharacterized protein n=1 Tax=Medicago truncatula TaxID=3880 RepID=UPI0019679FD8|nr:uncharacterized protein LOC120577013 [Medicago truncatula]